MRKLLVTAALLALAACATTLPQVIEGPGDLFDVRFEAGEQTREDADVKANAHCPGAVSYVSEETRFDGFVYRTYNCAGR